MAKDKHDDNTEDWVYPVELEIEQNNIRSMNKVIDEVIAEVSDMTQEEIDEFNE